MLSDMMQDHIIKVLEEDEKTFLRFDANVTDNQALTLEYIHVDGFTESAYWNRSFGITTF